MIRVRRSWYWTIGTGIRHRAREAAVETLFSKRVWLGLLLDALEEEDVPTTHIDSVRKTLLRNHKDDGVRTRAAALFDGSPDNNSELLASYADVLEMEGDAERGHTLYRENCAILPP